MTEIFIGITIAAVVAAVAAVWVAGHSLRTREGQADPSELSMLVQSEFNRLAEALGRQASDDRELRTQMDQFRRVIEDLKTRSEERARNEEAAWETVRRLDTVLAGGSSRGRAGENLLHDALSSLPPGMVVHDFQVNGKRVEFALVLPDGKHMPVDAKWAGAPALEALEQAEDEDARESAAASVEREVAKRAKEVAGYVDAAVTTPFAVACVPDAAYDVCRKVHGDAYRRNVLVVPFSSAPPLLLSLYMLASRFGEAGDAQASLAEIETLLRTMEHTVENSVVRATRMLQNAADTWRTDLGRARGAVARGRASNRRGEALDLTDAGRPSLEVVEAPEPVASLEVVETPEPVA